MREREKREEQREKDGRERWERSTRRDEREREKEETDRDEEREEREGERERECVDLNARTDLFPNTPQIVAITIFFGQSFPQNIVNFPRNNTDDQVNKTGSFWWSSVEASVCTSLNGSVKGDSLGRYIYTSFHGCSTVHNMITDLDPFSFRAFTVKPLTPL